MERIAVELIPIMGEEAINKETIYQNTALYLACRNKMERVIKMIEE
jgi:hypothetical protein